MKHTNTSTRMDARTRMDAHTNTHTWTHAHTQTYSRMEVRIYTHNHRPHTPQDYLQEFWSLLLHILCHLVGYHIIIDKRFLLYNTGYTWFLHKNLCLPGLKSVAKFEQSPSVLYGNMHVGFRLGKLRDMCINTYKFNRNIYYIVIWLPQNY